MRQLKHQTRLQFEEAIRNFFAENYEDAKESLQTILDRNPGDFVAQYFLHKLQSDLS